MVPLVAERSLWQTPMASILMVTWLAAGESTSISSTLMGWFHWRTMTAFPV